MVSEIGDTGIGGRYARDRAAVMRRPTPISFSSMEYCAEVSAYSR